MQNYHLAAWALLLAGASVAAQTPPPPPIEVSAFVNGGGLESPRLSPDGSRLAGMVRTGTLRALVTQNTDGSDRKVVFTQDKPELDLDFVRWVANDRLLLRLVRSQGVALGSQTLPLSRLISVGADGSKPLVIAPNPREGRPPASRQDVEAELTCPSSPFVALPISKRDTDGFELAKFDARTGAPLGFTPDKGYRSWLVDSAGDARLAVSYEGAKPMSWLRVPGSKTFAALDLAVLKTYESWKVLGFDAQPNQLLVLADRDGVGHLLRVDVNEPDRAESLLTLPKGGPTGRTALVRNEATCQAVGLRVGTSTLLWGDNLSPFWVGLEKAVPNATLELVQWQGDRILVRMSAAGVPTRYLLGLRSARKLEVVAETFARLPGDLGLVTRDIRVGDLKATWLQRADAKGPLPTVLCVACELTRSEDAVHYQPLAAFLAYRGFGVLDVRSGGGGLPMLESLEQTTQQDRTALAEAARLGWSDAQRVAVVAGHGRASWQAMALSAVLQPPVRAVAVTGVVSDMGRFAYRDILGQSEVSELTKASLRRQIGSATEAQLSAASPLQRVDQWQAPLLLVHAETDGAVSVSHSQRLADALQAAGKPVTLLRLPQASAIEHPPYRAQVLKAIEDLLAPLLGLPQ